MPRLTPTVASVLAPNPGLMTLSGTNTWVLGDPALGPVAVVDPGPEDDTHLSRVLEVAGRSASTGAGWPTCGVRAADPVWRVGPDGLDDRTVLEAAGVRIEVLVTPGHTSDSVSLLATAGDGGGADLLTGDTVLGFGSTVITHPDGDLGAYLDSLDRLLAVVADRGVARILPGHGPVVDDPVAILTGYRQHRLERLDQVREALAAGARTPEEVLAAVYPDSVGTPIERAAAQSVRAQLDHLNSHRQH